MKGNEIFWASDRHNVETVTLSKYAAEYEHMRKWMGEFLKKFRGRGIKISWVNSDRVLKPLIIFNILCDVASQVTLSCVTVFLKFNFF